MAQPRLAHADDELRRAYSAEMRGRTLKTGRLVAVISVVGVALFLLQDRLVLGFQQFLVWRLAGLVPFLVFLALSFNVLKRKPALIVPLYTFSLFMLFTMICGIAATLILEGKFQTSDLHGVSSGIMVVVFGVYIFASGARRHVPIILLGTFSGFFAAVVFFSKLDAKEFTYFANPAILTIAVSVLSVFQDRLQFREFRERMRAEASERMFLLEHTKMATLLSALSEVAFVMSPDGKVEYGNETLAHISGVEKGSLVGMNAFELLPPDIAAKRRHLIREVMETGLPTRFTDQQGDLVFDSSVYPVKVEGGEVGHLVVLSRDVTEKAHAQAQIKRLLDEKSLLLKEVHHRIKNNMATIASLLSVGAFSSGGAESALALKEMSQRVHAMADIYDRLYRTETYTSVNLSSYLGNLVNDVAATFLKSSDVAVEAKVEEMTADPRLVFGIGIVINEFLTNALKYAFPAGRKGSVLVDVRAEGEGMRILVQDDGVGMPTPGEAGRKEGFGMQLVDIMVAQHGGTMTISGTAGTSTTILIPVRGAGTA